MALFILLAPWLPPNTNAIGFSLFNPTFILPFAVGVCVSLQGVNSVLQDAFGIVSMVAMTPLITIQLLGFRSIVSHNIKEKIAMRKILDADDEQIIDFI